jgi:hypothetical protein
MNGELHQNPESVINLHLLIRDKICPECIGNKKCTDLECLDLMFRLAGKIENKIEESHVGKTD